ncbi:MAG: hypothetical protein OEQ39_17905 [Gammaproteobacteria bacterium]|nr:hypothetical protein [Gammaproteobacteria bacterium]MDH3464904.1 hypothetical protein [Gammaproteobacteria bacterium]
MAENSLDLYVGAAAPKTDEDCYDMSIHLDAAIDHNRLSPTGLGETLRESGLCRFDGCLNPNALE